jgi:hypothetical protein
MEHKGVLDLVQEPLPHRLVEQLQLLVDTVFTHFNMHKLELRLYHQELEQLNIWLLQEVLEVLNNIQAVVVQEECVQGHYL